MPPTMSENPGALAPVLLATDEPDRLRLPPVAVPGVAAAPVWRPPPPPPAVKTKPEGSVTVLLPPLLPSVISGALTPPAPTVHDRLWPAFRLTFLKTAPPLAPPEPLPALTPPDPPAPHR
jgi:hypothetical protein